MTQRNSIEERVAKDSNRTETGQFTGDAKAAASEKAKRLRLPKSHQDYWLSRLAKRTYQRKGETKRIEVPEWQVRMFCGNKEGWFNLGTQNKNEAAAQARKIWRYISVHGWDETIAKFKPGSVSTPIESLTVGEFLDAVKHTGALRLRTFLNYQNCCRTIVGEAFGVRLKNERSKFDYRAGGNQEWVGRIDGFRLARVTPERVEKWRQKRLKAAGNSPVRIASAKRTVNTYIRCARSLFSKGITGKLKGVQLPSPLPFDGVGLFESGSMKYNSKINAQSLIVAAENELKTNYPEAYKAFLLAAGAGLRKAEIDSLEWAMLDLAGGAINLYETEYLHLKTNDSAGEIALDKEVLDELREFMPRAKSRFIIESNRPARNDSARPYYRCEPVFEALTDWLRGKGIKTNKPLHELRKEVGAQIATEYGIYAASRFLRHSDISTTARHYADQKDRISVGFGKFLRRGLKQSGESQQSSEEQKGVA